MERYASRVQCRINAPDYAQLEEGGQFRIEDFRKNFKVVILNHTEEEIVFEMIGINVAIANALRRIMVAEVPTMAIEKVIIRNNTTIIHDEMLAHRLGLVPLRANPDDFEMLPTYEGMKPTPETTLVFKMQVACKRKPKSKPVASAAATDKYENAEALTDKLVWTPIGDQASKFGGANGVAPVHADILLAKMRPGQEINLEAHAVKGIGREHAKWSPVATASYQMLPEVHILKDFEGDDAHKLVEICPMKVFDIEDFPAADGGVRATVAHPRRCTLCRECIRHDREDEDKKISLERVKNHFIFSVESSGCMPPAQIVTTAIKILRAKAKNLTQEVEGLYK